VNCKFILLPLTDCGLNFSFVVHRQISLYMLSMIVVQRRPPEAPVRSGVLKRDDNVKRGRGRPNLTWDESVKRDLKEWNISRN